MPAVGAAAVTAGAGLAAAHMQSRTADRAMQAEERARQAALDYQGSQERRRRADYRRQYEDWYQHTYGRPYQDGAAATDAGASTPVGNLGSITGANPGPTAGAVPNTMTPGAGTPAVPPANGTSPLAQGSRPASIADLAVSDRWSDWGRYGVGGSR